MNLLPFKAGASPFMPSPFSPWHVPQVSWKNVTILGSAAAAAPNG